MKKSDLKRIAIIGLPGSGKSTFAMELGDILHLPVHHLDNYCFVNGVKADPQDLIANQQKLVDQESWIIEGCSIKTLEMRLRRADMVVYLDFPRLLCVWRVFKRLFMLDHDLSKSGCATLVNWELLKYIWNFKKEKSERIEALRAQYPKLDFYVLKSAKELDQFVQNIKVSYGA